MTRTEKNRKKVTTKNSKFKSKNQKIEKKKDCFVNLKVMKNASLIKDIMVGSKVQTGIRVPCSMCAFKATTKGNLKQHVGRKHKIVDNDGPKVLVKKQEDFKAKDRADRALKREEKEKEKAQVEDREGRAERRALRLASEWQVKREKERQLLKKNEDSMIEKAKILSLEETKETSTKIMESPVFKKPSPPKDKNETKKSEKEIRMEAREKAREEEERKAAEEYWPEWDEMKKTKKKRKKTADRLVFKKSDYNMTDSDESSDDDEDTRYPDRTSEPSNEVAKPAQSDKPTKHIPSWAQGELLEQALEKQSDPSSYDLDSLFSKAEMPDIKLMFPKIKKKFIRRTSSAIWLAPPPASFRVAA